MYNPKELMKECDKLENGKPKMAGLKAAIQQADDNHDIAYQIYFRSRYLSESIIYGDSLESMIVFPEMLALIDANPNAPVTPGENSGFKNATERVLWFYKMILAHCIEFYQIPYADCERFFEDFKQRSIAYGYNLRSYYKYKYFLYRCIGDSRANEEFNEFINIPRDGNADCKACEQNTIVLHYMLDEDDLGKAMIYAKDLESRKLRCSGDDRSWIRLKTYYLKYALKHKDFEEAKNYIRLIRYNTSKLKVCDISEDELYFYAYTDVSKGLKLFKEKWKEWLQERNPDTAYSANRRIALFFKKLGESRTRKTVKIAFDRKFPLYREDDTYEIAKLYEFYYNSAKDLADKFDKRNGNRHYNEELDEMLNGDI